MTVTFDFELLSNLAPDLLAQLLELLAERRAGHVRLQSVLAAQLQQSRIPDVVALQRREQNVLIKTSSSGVIDRQSIGAFRTTETPRLSLRGAKDGPIHQAARLPRGLTDGRTRKTGVSCATRDGLSSFLVPSVRYSLCVCSADCFVTVHRVLPPAGRLGWRRSFATCSPARPFESSDRRATVEHSRTIRTIRTIHPAIT